MGFLKEEKGLKKLAFLFVPRWMKTLFFLITMLVSLLLFSVPILLIIADVLLPAALFSASIQPPPSSLTLQTLLVHLNKYDFRLSLIDIPLVSIARSAIILCVYSFCDGPRLSRWPYLGVATVCYAASLVFVSLKGSYVWMNGGYSSGAYAKATELGLFISSLGLAIGHVAVAYRTSCRERRKLLVYKIDIEAISSSSEMSMDSGSTRIRNGPVPNEEDLDMLNRYQLARMGFLDIIKKYFYNQTNTRMNNRNQFKHEIMDERRIFRKYIYQLADRNGSSRVRCTREGQRCRDHIFT